jgi:hypothetical protein
VGRRIRLEHARPPLRSAAPDARHVAARVERCACSRADPRIAGELLSAILARALQPAANGAPDADALFDAGYLIESYKQAAWLDRQHARSEDRGAWWMGSQPAADGYALVTRASTLGGLAPEMEFAASLMKDGTVADEHRRRASAGASTDSLLARNLECHEK